MILCHLSFSQPQITPGCLEASEFSGIPFISPAYLALTFAALIFSHIYLYVYDTVKASWQSSTPPVHWETLRRREEKLSIFDSEKRDLQL